MELTEITIVPLVLALTEAVKRSGVPARYAPFVSIAIGVAISLIFISLTPESAIKGIIFGLSASGLWSGGRAVTQ